MGQLFSSRMKCNHKNKTLDMSIIKDSDEEEHLNQTELDLLEDFKKL